MPEAPRHVIPLANDEDFKSLQGGMPSVSVSKDGITRIVHNYPKGEGMIVVDHKPIESWGTVTFFVEGKGYRQFPIAMVRSLHGEPCEKRSIKAGGDQYDRLQD